jgi:integrase
MKYRATAKYLGEYFQNKGAAEISIDDAYKFIKYLKQHLSDRTIKEWVGLLKAAWQWGEKQGILSQNPWEIAIKGVKVPPKQPPKPFTKEEIGAIIHAFRSDRYYHHYADYVEFLFSTGCRTAEAIGLRWKHLSDDCSTIWIGESLSRGIRKSTKTNRARFITLTPTLQAKLLARRLPNFKPDDLVFTSPTGKPIDDCNFRNRAWKTVLTRLEIDYRKPYCTRSSLISHALNLGMNPVTVAVLTGHDVRTLYEKYAGDVNSKPRLPELLGGEGS